MKTITQRVLLLSFLLLFFIPNALAQSEIVVTGSDWSAEFRDSLTFTLSAQSSAEIVEVDLRYKIIGQVATARNQADFTPGTTIDAVFELDQSDPSNYLPSGTELEYWWKIIDSTGNELTTERERLLFLDNRYDWQTLENDRLTLYWYEGGASFGQALFDRANLALDTLEQDTQIIVSDSIRIFIYANNPDLLDALSTSAQEWTGGVAYPDFGIVMLGVRPNQLEWGERAMTHEITHLVIHQVTDNPYGDLPKWLDEGIAVHNEDTEQLVIDFQPLFAEAVANDELMTLRTLSSPFPGDPRQANLAYGQSGAVVKFIIDTYGADAMGELLEIFAEGELYDDALRQALGVDMTELDNEFRVSLGLDPLPGTEIPAALPEPEPEAESEPAPTTVETAPEPTQATELSKNSAPSVDAELQSEPVSTLPCLAGLLPLFGLVWLRSRQS